MGATRVVAVVLVFVVSLAALAASSALALWGPADELATRDRLRAAAAELSAAAREPTAGLSDHTGSLPSELDNRRLAEVARRVLANYPDAEGGFYLTRSDQFAGAVKSGAEPLDQLPDDTKKAIEKKDADRKSDKKKGDKKDTDKKAAPRKEGA